MVRFKTAWPHNKIKIKMGDPPLPSGHTFFLYMYLIWGDRKDCLIFFLRIELEWPSVEFEIGGGICRYSCI